MNTVVRKGSFDSGHRVMHERFKCFNAHGHTYLYELEFEYGDALEIGYAIDFKEIKRVACQWIDDILDHGFIANPKDTVMIEACKAVGSKLYLMHLTDQNGYCNPSAENIAKEIFFAVSVLLNNDNLWLNRVVLHETPNCFVTCEGLSSEEDDALLDSDLYQQVNKYREEKCVVEYDLRKVSEENK